MNNDALILSVLAGIALCVAILASLAALLGLVGAVLTNGEDPYATGILLTGLVFAPPFAGFWALGVVLANRQNADRRRERS